MESLQPSSAQYRPTNMVEVKWSPPEKKIARGVFEAALQRELDAITHEELHGLAEEKLGYVRVASESLAGKLL